MLFRSDDPDFRIRKEPLDKLGKSTRQEEAGRDGPSPIRHIFVQLVVSSECKIEPAQRSVLFDVAFCNLGPELQSPHVRSLAEPSNPRAANKISCQDHARQNCAVDFPAGMHRDDENVPRDRSAVYQNTGDWIHFHVSPALSNYTFTGRCHLTSGCSFEG